MEDKKSGKYSRMRNLAQYRDLSDEEFDEVITKKSMGIEQSKGFEDRISRKLQEFENDYDLSDMKINDMDTLRALIQAQISLEDYEQHQYKLRSAGITDEMIYASEKLSKIMSDLRADISKFQQDLNITRKVRKSDKELSTIAYLSNLQAQAKKYYEQKMQYIFCPKCNMLLGTIWCQYPHNDRNKVHLICGRVYPDGSKCGEKVTVSIDELVKNRGTNKREVTPESFL
jgi:hypothetical protein